MADELTKLEENKQDLGTNNPTGKGGFQDHPENINRNGRPKKELSITYWIREFLSQAEPGHEKQRVQELAEQIVLMAYKDKNVAMIKELLDRLEGTNPIRFDEERADIRDMLKKIYATDKDNRSDTGDSK